MLRGRSHARGEGHGTHHKTTVVGAVEVRTRKDAEDRAAKWKEAHGGGIPTKKLVYAGRLRPKVVSGKGADNLTSFIKENVAAGSTIRTDGWQGYNDLPEMGYSDDSLVLGGDPDKAESHLPMIHLVFSNLKTWILGTHHGRIAPHHLQAYLNEYVFRFNRRFYPMTAFNSVLGLAARALPPTYAQLYSGSGCIRQRGKIIIHDENAALALECAAHTLQAFRRRHNERRITFHSGTISRRTA